MKLEKAQWVLLALTALFVTFTLAFFIGRNSVNAVITTQSAAISEKTEIVTSSGQETQKETQAQQEVQAPLSVNLNTATQAELEALPGIGPTLAQRIIAWREENGPFVSTEQLMDVEGIAEGKFEDLKDLIYVEDAE